MGRFVHIFIQALWIEVRYVLVYIGVEGCMEVCVWLKLWHVYSVFIAYELCIVISSIGAALTVLEQK